MTGLYEIVYPAKKDTKENASRYLESNLDNIPLHDSQLERLWNTIYYESASNDPHRQRMTSNPGTNYGRAIARPATRSTKGNVVDNRELDATNDDSQVASAAAAHA